MNTLILVGLISSIQDLKVSPNGVEYVYFTIATRNTSAQKATSFVNCVAFGKKAELLCKYFVKGSPIGIEAEVRNNNYLAKNGNMQYTYNFVVKQVHFVGKKESNPAVAMESQAAPATAPVAPGALPFPPAPPATAPAASGGLPLPPAPPATAPATSGVLPFPPAPSTQPAPSATPFVQPMPADADGSGQGIMLGRLEDVFTQDEMKIAASGE